MARFSFASKGGGPDALCGGVGCGRPARVCGLCIGHYRGVVRVVDRPLRERAGRPLETVGGGFRLSPATRRRLRARARREGLSLYALLVSILESAGAETR